MRSTLSSLGNCQDFPNQGVLLIGDAIHAMPKLGGEDGNSAIKDGFELAERLAANGPEGRRTLSNVRYWL